MKLKFYAKLYALPLGIICACFLVYYFVFDSLTQYQQRVVTITQVENPQNNDEIDEKVRMKKELEKIKQSSNVDFIHNTLSENLNRISTYANIEFEDTKAIAHTEPKQKPSNPQNRSTIEVNKIDNVDYVPYRQIHTHELPNAFSANLNSPTNIKLYNTNNPYDVKSIQIAQKNKKQWATPTTKQAKIYHSPNTQSKIIAINKDGIKMQVIDTKKSWAHVRYAINKETFIDGYIPLQNIRFVNK